MSEMSHGVQSVQYVVSRVRFISNAPIENKESELSCAETKPAVLAVSSVGIEPTTFVA